MNAAGWVMFACVVVLSLLATANLRLWRYWFNAFLGACRELPPSSAIRHLDERPVPKFWLALIPWRRLP